MTANVVGRSQGYASVIHRSPVTSTLRIGKCNRLILNSVLKDLLLFASFTKKPMKLITERVAKSFSSSSLMVKKCVVALVKFARRQSVHNSITTTVGPFVRLAVAVKLVETLRSRAGAKNLPPLRFVVRCEVIRKGSNVG